MTGIKKINLISAVLVSLSLCGGCTLEKAEKEEINEIHLRLPNSLTGLVRM